MAQDAASRREGITQRSTGTDHQEGDLLDLLVRLGRQLSAAPVKVEEPAPENLSNV